MYIVKLSELKSFMIASFCVSVKLRWNMIQSKYTLKHLKKEIQQQTIIKFIQKLNTQWKHSVNNYKIIRLKTFQNQK